jgi:hypothetical protein
MQLKPQDIVVVLKLVALGGDDWSYNRLAVSLHMSPSEVHAAVKRALAARLAVHRDGRAQPNVRNLREFLLHGIQYVFIPQRSELTRGVPTGFYAEPFSSLLVPTGEAPVVWPDPDGKVRGQAFSPLYKSVPKAVSEDKKLYELLALVDALRGGNAMERNIAALELEKRLNRYSGQLPRLNKAIVHVTALDDVEEEKKYWFSKTFLDRIEAIEINRRMVYGHDRVTSRLQRFFETAQLS